MAGTCLNTYNIEDANIYSSNFPNDYPNNEDCSWIIRSPPNTHIELLIEELEIQSHNNGCELDWLKIDDGSSRADNTICGFQKNPTSYVSPLNKFILTFHSNQLTTKRGFKISYKLHGRSLVAINLLNKSYQSGSFKYLILNMSCFRLVLWSRPLPRQRVLWIWCCDKTKFL